MRDSSCSKGIDYLGWILFLLSCIIKRKNNGIGAALYAAASMISINVGPSTSLRLAVALLCIFGAIFGPVVGFLVGFIGHALNDAISYGSVWWSWVFMCP